MVNVRFYPLVSALRRGAPVALLAAALFLAAPAGLRAAEARTVSAHRHGRRGGQRVRRRPGPGRGPAAGLKRRKTAKFRTVWPPRRWLPRSSPTGRSPICGTCETVGWRRPWSRAPPPVGRCAARVRSRPRVHSRSSGPWPRSIPPPSMSLPWSAAASAGSAICGAGGSLWTGRDRQPGRSPAGSWPLMGWASRTSTRAAWSRESLWSAWPPASWTPFSPWARCLWKRSRGSMRSPRSACSR